MTGFNSKRQATADKLQEPVQKPVGYLHTVLNAFGPDAGISLDQKAWSKLHAAIKAALAQPARKSEILTIVYQSGYHDGKQAALAGREWNFCERCGKRTANLTVIHTCTPPKGNT